MFNNEAFQQDLLVTELEETGIVGRPSEETTSPLGFSLVNHNRNNNIKIQIRPKKHRPSVPDAYTHQNPTAFVDEERGELNMCLTHADKFVISCAGAPNHYVFATSFGQMLADLARNNPNIQIIINGQEYGRYTADDPMDYYGSWQFDEMIRLGWEEDVWFYIVAQQAGNMRITLKPDSRPSTIDQWQFEDISMMSGLTPSKNVMVGDDGSINVCLFTDQYYEMPS